MIKPGDIVQLRPLLYEGTAAQVVEVLPDHYPYPVVVQLLGPQFLGLPGVFKYSEVEPVLPLDGCM